MYATAYDTIIRESASEAREKEKQAFDHALNLLRAANESTENSRKRIDALLFVERMWSILLEDLSEPQNALPQDLKARLISIGIWILKEIVALRQRQVTDLGTLIEINQIIRDGLD